MKPSAYFRNLADGRIEIAVRGNGVAMKVSGPPEKAWALVDVFEDLTGLMVDADQRPTRARPQIKGQMSLVD